MFSFYRSFAVLVFASISSVGFAQVLEIQPQSVEAQSWVILDPQSHQVIAAHGADQQRAPASLTKMMVGYLALKAIENGKLKLDQVITVPDVVTSVQSDESRLRLKPHQQITVQELVSGLIIMSANDAALTLGTLIAGDIPSFVQLMNQTAKSLNMQHTHFSNPSGITMQDHYASALDLALLAQAIVKDTPEYLNYSKQQQFQYHDIFHHATNILLKIDPSVDGLKTGYTEAAGYNLALTANRLDPNTNEYRRLIVVVMGTASKFKRADVAYQLLNIAYEYTQTKRLFDHDQKIAEIPVVSGKQLSYQVNLPHHQGYTTLSLLSQNTPLNAQQFDQKLRRFVLPDQPASTLEPLKKPVHIHYQIQPMQQQIDAPIHSTLNLVKINVQQFQQTVHSVDVVDEVNIEQASWWNRLFAWIKSWVQSAQGHHNTPVIYPITAQ